MNCRCNCPPSGEWFVCDHAGDECPRQAERNELMAVLTPARFHGYCAPCIGMTVNRENCEAWRQEELRQAFYDDWAKSITLAPSRNHALHAKAGCLMETKPCRCTSDDPDYCALNDPEYPVDLVTDNFESCSCECHSPICMCGHRHDDHARGTAYGLEVYACTFCGCPEYSGPSPKDLGVNR